MVRMLAMKDGGQRFVDVNAFSLYHREPLVDRLYFSGKLLLRNGP